MNRARSLPAAATIALLSVTAFVALVALESDPQVAAFGLLAVPFSVMGMVIVARSPGNRIGWLFTTFSSVIVSASVLKLAGDSDLPWAWLAAWLSDLAWVPVMATVVASIYLFPEGRPPGPARVWSVPLWLLGLFAITALVGNGFAPSPDNPLAVPEMGSLWGVLTAFAGICLVLSVLSAIVSLVVRYRRGDSDERHQLKWMLATACLFPVVLPISDAFQDSFGPYVMFGLFMVVPISMGVAILKYRLYEIDVVISKTLVFAGLATFITAIYVGIVVGIGTLLGAGGEPNLALSIVATAVVAVAFQPARERLTRVANRLVFGKRATPYEVLSRFSTHLGDTVASEGILEHMARLLADGTGAQHAQVSLSVAGQLVPVASVGEVDASEEVHAVEVTHQGECLGALSVTKQRGETLTPADVKLADDLGAHAGLVLRNLLLTEQLKARIVELTASRQRLVSAQDAERRRLERDLHDGAQHQLVELKTRLAGAHQVAQQEQATNAAQVLQQLTVDADDAVATLRELAYGIYPPLLAAEGLAGALVTQAAKAVVPVTVDAHGIGRYGQDIEAAVYFCVLEALNNVAKYASPSQVTIRLTDHDGQLTFEVSDDGDGFDPHTTPRGHGTTNMADRLDALNGNLEIRSAPGAGTTIAGSVALQMTASLL